jgi:DNA polymerase epsilon subunit 2
MAVPARRAVVAAFGERGLRLEASAATLLADAVADAGGGDGGKGALAALLDAYEPGEKRGGVWVAVGAGPWLPGAARPPSREPNAHPLSLSGASAVLDAAAARKLLNAASGADAAPIVTVVSAFDAPRVTYDPSRRAFACTPPPPSGAPRLGAAPDRASLYLDRFYRVAQRVERHPLFARPALAGAGARARAARGACPLADVRTLSGAPPGVTAYVLGTIAQLEDGRFFLEDPTGRVALDLSAAATSAGFFCEGVVAVVEGELTPARVLRARALGMPPAEARAATLAGPAAGADWFAGGRARVDKDEEALAAQAADPGRRLVVLADVRLDAPAAVDRLAAVFRGFESAAGPPPTFVLTGDFYVGPPSDAVGRAAAFARLAAAAAACPRLRDGSDWIFVPGAADALAPGALPLAPLRAADAAPLAAALPRAHFPSNPARVRVAGRDVVVFRSPMASTLRARALLPPAGGEGGGSAAGFEHAAVTLLQQAHLAPLPLHDAPVHWAADAGMALYPLPHALVLAGGGGPASFSFEGCACVDPGGFAAGGSFAAYAPASGAVEMCELPDE